MTPFNLEAALAGAPVQLRDGSKARVFININEIVKNELGFGTSHPLVGQIRDKIEIFSWRVDGAFLLRESEHPCDIVGMWEDPKLTSEQVLEKAYQENLPLDAIGKKAFVIAKTKDGDYVMQCGEDNLYFASHKTEWEFYKDPSPKSDTITVTLPKPFKAQKGDDFWFIVEDLDDNQQLKIDVILDSNGEPINYKDGNCFRTPEDAQAWLDAMKNALDN